MNQKLAKILCDLKSELDNSEEMKKLKELDNALNNNEEVMKLAYKKDMASIKYEDSLKHFGENSKEANDSQKELYEAKLALDSHPLVKEYNEQYKIVKEIYNKINDEIFNIIK